MTKEEFEAYYAAESGMTLAQLHESGLGAAPCDCGAYYCKRWQMKVMVREASSVAYKGISGKGGEKTGPES